MARIHPLTHETANDTQRQILDGVKKKLGKVPNLLASMAQSPAAVGVYLAAGDAISKSTLSPQLREKLAVTIAQTNSCDYCLSAHTAIGGMLGVSADELQAAREAQASSAKEQVALEFAKRVVEQRGHLTDSEVQVVYDAGYTQAEVAELIAVVAINTFTNYFNHIAETEVDFPLVSTQTHVAA